MCGVRGGVAPKQWSSYSAIIHLVQRQAAAAVLTLSLWVAGYNSRWTAVDTGPHSHIPPWEKTWKSERKRVPDTNREINRYFKATLE